ncbi:MAG: hypothetical protein ACM3SO_11555 [Betaproteobacteria bacterium]
MAIDSEQVLAQNPLAIGRTRGERLFLWGAAVALLVVVGGFSRTYYLRSFLQDESLPALVHVHGLVMTLWFGTVLAQVLLVRTGNVRIHRKVGVFGVGIAALVLVVGTMTAIAAVRQGHTPGPPPLVFLAIPLGDMVVFATLVTLGVVYRKRADFHKRYMLMASLGIVTAAIARVQFLQAGGLPLFFGLTDLIVIGFVLTDTVGKRRLHPAFAIGLAVVIASQVGRFLIAGTPAWQEFAKWLTS